MSTYDDSLLAARFAALAPEPLAGNWGDVLAEQARLGSDRSVSAAFSSRAVVAGSSSCSLWWRSSSSWNRRCVRRSRLHPRPGLRRPAASGSDAQRPGERRTPRPLGGNSASHAKLPAVSRARPCPRMGVRRRANDLVSGGEGLSGPFPRPRTSSPPATSSNDSRRRASSSCGRRSPGSSIAVALSSSLCRPTTIRGWGRTAAWLSSFR